MSCDIGTTLASQLQFGSPEEAIFPHILGNPADPRKIDLAKDEQSEYDDTSSYSSVNFEDPAWIDSSVSSVASTDDWNLARKDGQGDEDTLPSVGAKLHESGQCRPCAWFWKPGGCQNGRDCCHCHLCPEGEIKHRKKTKALAFSTVAANPLSIAASWAVPTKSIECSQDGEVPAYVPLSVGSATHGIGSCKPCGFFHKPGGCRNGHACLHCHVCPATELKTRRKAKQLSLFNTRNPPEEGDFNTLMKAICLPKMLPQNSNFSEEESEDDEASAGGLGRTDDELEKEASTHLPDFLLPSVGSLLHKTGKCKPCAWFHKPGGCKNGQECRHCHLCPNGELKRIKKAKLATMKVFQPPRLRNAWQLEASSSGLRTYDGHFLCPA